MNSNIAKWVETKVGGLSRSELLSLLEPIRKQRSAHKSIIFDTLKVYLKIFSIFLAAETAIFILYLRGLMNLSPEDITVIVKVIGGVICVFCGVITFGMSRLEKKVSDIISTEYRKLLEYLSVEQKIEHLLGIRSKLTVNFALIENLPYKADVSLAHKRWVDGSTEYDSSEEFRMRTIKDTFYHPLKDLVCALVSCNVALAIAALIVALATIFR